MDKKLQISLLFDFYGQLLTDKQRDIIYNYYNNDFSLSEIADNLNITRQGVFDNLKRAETTLLEMENKIGLYKRFEEIQNIVNKININALNILEENKNANKNVNIDNNANNIIKLLANLKE